MNDRPGGRTVDLAEARDDIMHKEGISAFIKRELESD
jgi:hypothetical protein